MVYASPHIICTKCVFIFKGASNENFFKISMAGPTKNGNLSTGRSSRVHSCPLDLSNASRLPRIHGWLHTNCQKSKISPDTIDAHHCPRCLQPNENQEHILKCPNPGAHKHRYKLVHPMMTKIIQNPGCRVQQVFELIVWSWLADSEPPTPDISEVPIKQQDLLVEEL
jgi:hypothetical protein